MAAWGKSREEREREYHEIMAKLDAAEEADRARPDDEGALRYTARLFAEQLLVLVLFLAICAVGAAIGAAVAGTLGLFLGFLAGAVVCGLLSVVGFVSGIQAWRRGYKRR